MNGAEGRDAVPGDDLKTGECPDAVTMAGYLDGKLDGEELRRMQAHLEVCAACREEVEELREIMAEGGITPESPERSRALADLIINAKDLVK